MRARVFVRGVGAVSSLGATWRETSRALADGACGVRSIDSFDTTGFPCSVAAPVAGADGPDRRRALAVSAACEAWQAAGFADARERAGRVGVYFGAETGLARFDHAFAVARGRVVPVAITSPAAIASAIARLVDADGPVLSPAIACASGAAAIVEAARALRAGACDTAICGGVGADVDPVMLAAFGRLGALSEQGVSRPFDVRRDGFVLGEGAAALVLSRDRGGAPVELRGVGRSLDAHHLTAPPEDGGGAELAMRAALDDAGVDAVDAIQAHGTSTPLNDEAEAAAIRRVLGGSLDRVSVSSVKGALGHWIAGAGALGAACAHDWIVGGVVPAIAGLRDPDPRCALPLVVSAPARRTVDVAMVNAFGFGGANVSLVLARCAA